MRRSCKKATFDSIEFIAKMQALIDVEDDGRRHCVSIRPNRSSARLMLLLHCRSFLRFYIQIEAITQMSSSIPKQSSRDINSTALPSEHKKRKSKLSTELNTTDDLSLAEHHKTTKPSNGIDKNLSFLPSIPNQTVLDPSLSFLAFTLYWNVESDRC